MSGEGGEFTDEELLELQAELDELERTDPDVAAAAASYDRMVERITGRTLAAVPDPRFRDQLAEELECATWCNSNYRGGTPGCDCLDAHRRPQADALMSTIDAEVEARVQAAAAPLLAKLRAVEALAAFYERFEDRDRADTIRRALDAS